MAFDILFENISDQVGSVMQHSGSFKLVWSDDMCCSSHQYNMSLL